MVRSLVKFDKKPFAPGIEVTAEPTDPSVFSELQLRFGGSYTASSAAPAANDGPWNAISKIEITNGGRPVIDMPGSDMRHLTAQLTSGYPQVAPGGLATSGDRLILAQGHMPFGRLNPAARIDGRGSNINLKVRFGPIADLGPTCATYVGEVEAVGVHDDNFDDSGLFWEPHFRTFEVILNATQRNGFTEKFADYEAVSGIFIRQRDESVAVADPNLGRADTLVRKVRVRRQKVGKAQQDILPEIGWSMLKARQGFDMGISAAVGQLHAGVASYMFDDPRKVGTNMAMFGPNDTLTVLLDAVSALDLDLVAASNPTLETGVDRAFVTVLGWRPRGRKYEAAPRQTLADSGILFF